MRRWLAVFLLICLPLQFCWAAAGVYCQHESGAAADHFGHHEHQHHQAKGDPDQPDPSVTGGVDPDCSACHAGCASALFGAIEMPVMVVSDQGDFAFGVPPPSALFERPERPKWQCLA